MKKALMGLALASMALTATPAEAHKIYNHHGQKIKHSHGKYGGWDVRRDNRRYQYQEPYRYSQRYWKGNDGRYYCRKADGTIGLLIGGAVGALLGQQVERGEGAIIGGALGALIGREIDRGKVRCR